MKQNITTTCLSINIIVSVQTSLNASDETNIKTTILNDQHILY